MPTQRYDRLGRFSRVDATPQGGLAVPAYLTRTGVFVYTRADGTRTRELRHPDDVFSSSSMASLRGAPLTVGHPGMVTPETYKRDSIGHVGDDVRQDGRFVAATVRVQDATAVKGVTDGDLVELSCGYACDVAAESGTYDGEPYDHRQRNISYNHVGMGGRDWGRAGNDVSLKLDGDAAYSDTLGPAADGQQYHSSNMTPEQIAALQAELAQLKADAKARQDSADALATLTGKCKALESQVATLTTELATAKQAKTDAASPDVLDKLVTERVEVITQAKALAGDKFDAKGKTNAAIMREAVAVALPNVKFDSDAEVKGAFLATVARVGETEAARADVLRADPKAGNGRADGEDPIAKARAEQNARTYKGA